MNEVVFVMEQPEQEGLYEIRPEHIDIDTQLVGLFNKPILNKKTFWLLRYYQDLGLWKPFETKEIQTFCYINSVTFKEFYEMFPYNYRDETESLVNRGLIMRHGKHFFITKKFIDMLWNKFPKITIEEE